MKIEGKTIQEIFLNNINSKKESGITFIEGKNKTQYLSYKKLYLEASYKLHALQEKGLQPGDEVVFQFQSNKSFLISFWACVLGGFIPVPVVLGTTSDIVNKINKVWKKLKNPYIISDFPSLKEIIEDYNFKHEGTLNDVLSKFISYDELGYTQKANPVSGTTSDIVFVQFSSGSTGTPKGVINTQDSIIYNINLSLKMCSIQDTDKFLGWMPLTHDMGLVFFHLLPLLANVSQFLMPPMLFLSNPELWLESLSEQEITISGSPNFGYVHVLENIENANLEGLSFDKLKIMANGAEPVSIQVCRNFTDILKPYGFKKKSMKPGYGLAEAVLMVSRSDREDGFKEYFLNRNKLRVGDKLEFLESNSIKASSFADLGHFEGTEIKITDGLGKTLEEDTLGIIHLKSKAITQGYYNDIETTEKLISKEGWFNTGDIGFIHERRLVITGREKEMIIINGQNYFPNDIDNVLEELPEIKFQQAISCNVFNKNKYQDELFVFVLYLGEVQNFVEIANSIKKLVSDRIGVTVTNVIAVEKIPRTTSGKIQRYVLVNNYLKGDYDRFLNDLDEVSEGFNTDLYTPPTTEIECALAKIWQEYFDIDKVGIEANFYFLGGNSIGMGRLARKIEEGLGVTVDIRKLFTCVDFIDQVKLIDKAMENPFDKIEKASIKSSYPLFTTQKRLFGLYQSDTQSLAYNTPVVLEIEGTLDIKLCEDVFKEIINRHEILRTSFNIFDGKPMQQIHDNFDFEIEIVNDGDSVEVIKKHIKPFNLNNPPLIRVLVCREGSLFTKIILDVHHIVSDGASFEVLTREFNQLYAKESIAPLKFQYRDFIEWNEKKSNGLNLDSQKQFWMDKYTELVEPINLPTDNYNEGKEKFDGDTVTFDFINKEQEKELKKLCKKEKVTMSTMTLTVFNILLSKLTNNDDIVISTSSLGRWNKEVKDLIGLFIDTLPIRSNPSGNLEFSDFLQKVKINVLDSIENGEYSFEKLYKELKLKKNSNSNSFSNIAFECYDFNWSNTKSSDLYLSSLNQVNIVSKFPLILKVIENENGCTFCLDYSLNSFSRETVERFGKYYMEIVSAIIDNSNIQLKDIEILSQADMNQQLFEFNNTSTVYEKNKTLVDIFSSQVKNYPDKIALTFEDESLTYEELDKRSTQLARYINKNDKTNSALIGLCLDRSIDMIVGIFGILKSGRGYVPIDESYPFNRISHIIKDSGLALVLTKGTGLASFKNVKKLLLDGDKDLINKESTEEIPAKINSNDAAYVIYTSGSTGKPKGVLVNHQNVINLAQDKGALSIKPTDRVLQWSNVAFDGSVFDIFCSLLNGATLCLIDKKSATDVKSLSAFIKENKVSISLITTALFNVFVDTDVNGLLPLNKVVIGGEKLSLKHIQKAYDVLGPGTMINAYGPTEITVYATCYSVDERPIYNVPIGKPSENTQAYVLDASGKLCGIGIVGELHIGGDGVTMGYLNDEEKTNAKFIVNPYNSGTRLYKTGDLVKWLPDGNLDFVGRKDDQVKLRGFRIELAEIEFQLDTIDEIKSSVVLMKEIEEKKYLVAYYKSNDILHASIIREYLSEILPEYMLPSFYVHLKEFPLTANGKVNRKALPEPIIIKEKGYVAPSTEIERKLVAIWADILKIDTKVISIEANFFNYGGDSLNVLFLTNSINKEFAVKMSPIDIIAKPTIQSIQEFIVKSSNIDHVSIPVAEVKTHYPLSSSQKRMYYSYEYDKDSIGYNVPIIATLYGCLDRDKLKVAFNKLIQRHESLRTVFEFFEGELTQRILPDVIFSIDGLENEEGLKNIIKSFIKPFDLSESPLFRVGLKSISDNEYILIIDSHHIISDGITSEVLLKELISFYNGENLPELRIQYKDYVIWEQGEEHQKQITKHKEYWLKRFTKETATLELPYDYPRPKEFNVLGKNHEIELDGDQVDGLKKMAQKEGVTMYTLFLTLYNLLLHKLSNQKDIVIGSPVSGRSHIDLETLAGVFINTLPLRNNVEGNLTFREILQQVQQNSIQDLEHQLYPYDDLVDELNIKRVSGRNSLFDVVLTYRSINDKPISNNSDLQVSLYEDLFSQAKFDLLLTVLNFGDKLKLNLTYRDELFKETTITRFMSYLGSIINQVLENDTVLLEDIDVMPEAEKTQQLVDFNNTCTVYEKNKTLVDIFSSQVKNYPDKIALTFEDENLTYEELDKRSTQLARYINKNDKTNSSLIGLCLDRSIDMIVGIFGVLKSGRGYVPIDASYPTNRISHIIKDSDLALVLTKENSLASIKNVKKLLLDQDKDLIDNESTEEISTKINSKDVAYVIYTSGSTGKPKGVLVNHQNVIKLVQETGPLSVASTDRVLQWANVAFDGSVFDIFCSLLNGATLFLIDKKYASDVQNLSAIIKNNEISISFLTTSLFNVFVDTDVNGLLPLKKVVVGGEKISLKHVQKAYDALGPGRVINGYGPTETTVFAINYSVDERPIYNVPIGKPLENTQAYVLDASGKLCGIGIVGELHIGGDGVTMGYLNDEEKTNAKFIDNPYNSGTSLYKTGDLVKWLSDGNLDFVGRKDTQVKLRGFRIELSEIEYQLNTLAPITGSFVCIKELDETKQLIAYYSSGISLPVSDIKSYLLTVLPDYMIPVHYVHLEEFPLTINGKINRKALPEPTITRAKEYLAPSNEMEYTLVTIWSDILKIDTKAISIDDSFFDLGGDSLNAVKLTNLISKTFSVDISLRELFDKQNIRGVADYIVTIKQIETRLENEVHEVTLLI